MKFLNIYDISQVQTVPYSLPYSSLIIGQDRPCKVYNAVFRGQSQNHEGNTLNTFYSFFIFSCSLKYMFSNSENKT